MRGAFLFLSRQKNLRKWMETSSQAQRMTSRFIAGLTLDDGLRVARELSGRGLLSSLDHLGENVTTVQAAEHACEAYLHALGRINREQLPCTVSLKLTAVGLDVAEDLCRSNVDRIARAARDLGTRIELDMEDASYTDRTLQIVHEMHEQYAAVRAVIQAYLYRSETDIEELNRKGVPVRLCKGAYKEPPSVAWPDKADVDRNFIKLMKLLFDQGTHPAIATHDDAIVGQAIAHIRSRGIKREQFEFQMLYGVGRRLQSQIADRGYNLRLYVPYGTEWYPYFMRRLAERPANVWFIAKNIVRD